MAVQPTHGRQNVGPIYPEISPPLQYSDLVITPQRLVASDEQSGCPRDPTSQPWSSLEEATSRARRIAAFQGAIVDDDFSEVMGGNSEPQTSNAKKIFSIVKSNTITEMYGKGSFLTRRAFGKYSTVRTQTAIHNLAVHAKIYSFAPDNETEQQRALREANRAQ